MCAVNVLRGTQQLIQPFLDYGFSVAARNGYNFARERLPLLRSPSPEHLQRRRVHYKAGGRVVCGMRGVATYNGGSAARDGAVNVVVAVRVRCGECYKTGRLGTVDTSGVEGELGE